MNNNEMNNNELNNIVIIGGGISGLYLLDLLKTKYKDLKIKLFERNQTIGGRIRTQYSTNNNNNNNNNKVLFETGPWRIHESHILFIELLNKYNLELEKLSISYNDSDISYTSYCNNNTSNSNKELFNVNYNKNNLSSTINLKTLKKKRGLSERDKIIISKDSCYLKTIENYSKTILNKNSKGVLYNINHSFSHTINENTKENYYVVKEGLSKIIEILGEKYNDFIFLNHRIIDIKKIEDYYEINILYRNGNNFEIKVEKCKYLFLALPPKDSNKFFIVNNYLQPLINSVDTIPLNHIYAYSKDLKAFKNNRFQLYTDTEFGKIISGNYGNNWFQIAYNSGENAKFFFRLKQNYPNLYKQIIIEKFKKMGFNISISKIKMFYWENAVHYWKTSFEFDEEKSVNKSIYPDPINLPNCFYIGEAFSSIHGWTEGALETTMKAFDIFNSIQQNKYIFIPVQLKPKYEYVIVDNRVIDVLKWKTVHPGSKKAIENHLFEDISQLFRHIPHTHNSWNILYNLQKYWMLNNKIGFFTSSSV